MAASNIHIKYHFYKHILTKNFTLGGLQTNKIPFVHVDKAIVKLLLNN